MSPDSASYPRRRDSKTHLSPDRTVDKRDISPIRQRKARLRRQSTSMAGRPSRYLLVIDFLAQTTRCVYVSSCFVRLIIQYICKLKKYRHICLRVNDILLKYSYEKNISDIIEEKKKYNSYNYFERFELYRIICFVLQIAG